MGNVAVVNYIFESDEDDDLKDITSPVIQSFFNIHLLTDQNDLCKKLSSTFTLIFLHFSK